MQIVLRVDVFPFRSASSRPRARQPHEALMDVLPRLEPEQVAPMELWGSKSGEGNWD